MCGKVERTILIVETTEQAESVIAGERGIINGAKPGHIVLCMATIDPFAARALGRAAGGQGHRHARCAGERRHRARAQSGELSVIVGGDAEVIAKCKDLFDVMGSRTFHVGPLGSGLAMKLVNNMLVQVNTVAVAEALVLGVKAGLDPQTIYDVVRSRPAPVRPGSCACRASSRATYAPGGTIDISYKDQELETAFAKRLGRAGAARERDPAGLPDGARAGAQQAGRRGGREGLRAAGRRDGRRGG